ncbi:MAG: aminomethyl-transferring glycine dehydrogenase subunit GcvPA [Planctomycetota bacterium]|jgi:glycine dehydrogenase subunit 1
MPYIPHTEDDVRRMLDAIGVSSIDELFAPIPEDARYEGPLGMPPAASELEIKRELTEAALETVTLDRMNSFLGAGAYDHFIPSIVDHLAGRVELYTAYTPYQPEASQGMLTAIFEYQSMIAALTGMEVSNASLYDGASGLAEAVLMAVSAQRKRRKVVLSGAAHPEHLETVETYVANLDLELHVVEPEAGLTDPAALADAVDADTACVAIQSPNFFGNVEDVFALSDAAKSEGALLIASVDPISLGVLAPPGEYDADIAVGEGQALGGEIWYGGPYFGFLAAKKQYVRRIPGRIVGETSDMEGRRGFVLTFQTREQHIRREKATSNICTNQGIIALRGAMYLAALGPRGIRDVAELCVRKSHYAAERLSAVEGFRRLHSAPFVKEFVLECPMPADEIACALWPDGIQPGVPLSRWLPDMKDHLLIAVTEKKTKDEIDALAEALERLVRRQP